MINETSIHCFLTLARTLNFTETARQTYMTQQSVSKYIAKLESEVGFQLFVRTRHHVSLTRAGENFYALFQDWETSYAKVQEETRRYYADRYRTLRVGCLEWLDLSQRLERAFQAVNEQLPGMSCTLEDVPLYELSTRLAEGELDVILTLSEVVPRLTGLRKEKVLETEQVLVCRREESTAASYVKEVGLRKDPAETTAWVRKQLRELSLPNGEITVTPNVESAYMAVKLGQGMLLSNRLTFDRLGQGLTCKPLGKSEQVLCCWRQEQENPAVAPFVAALLMND